MLKQFYNKGSKDALYVVKVWIWVWFIFLIFSLANQYILLRKYNYANICTYVSYQAIILPGIFSSLLFSGCSFFIPLINQAYIVYYTCVLLPFLFYILSVIVVCVCSFFIVRSCIYTYICFLSTVMIDMLFLGHS
jgi:hypothetical protein